MWDPLNVIVIAGRVDFPMPVVEEPTIAVQKK
jgi:hypothetical protein